MNPSLHPPIASACPRRPRPWLAIAAIFAGLLFGALRLSSLLPAALAADTGLATTGLLLAQWAVETLFAFGLAGTTLLSLAYLFGRKEELAPTGELPPTLANARIGIVYLCCGDLDPQALASLRRLRHTGPVEILLHDDLPGGDPRVDELLRTWRGDGGMPVRLLRRTDKSGSKAGAVNYVLATAGDQFDYLFLADNDSTALDLDCLAALLRPFAEPQVAAVQARNVKVVAAETCTVNRIASEAIEVFHLFLSAGSKHAFMPFVGHNALLCSRKLREVGGLLPGCFADDIDLTLRWSARGWRVVYCPQVRFGERHPPSYAAFRKRAYKWSCGSSQVLRRWLWPTLKNPQLAFAEKWGFVQFLGFYALQALVLFYTVLTFLVAPFVLDPDQVRQLSMAIAGTILPLLVFLPVLCFALRARWGNGLGGFLLVCWLCYGATDFPTTRGVLHGLQRKMRPWIPTNSIRGGANRALFGEAAFGAALLMVPLWFYPELLFSPLAFLVAGKFLAIPAMAELYQDGLRARADTRKWLPRLVRLLTPLLLLSCLLGAAFAQSPTAERPRVQGRQLLVDGQPYVVRGIHYSPWHPGTGPGRSPYPAAELIAVDMALVARANANTIFVFDAPRYVLDAAWQHGIRVLHGSWLEWPQFHSEAFAAQEDAALDLIRSHADHPAVLGWVLGNEIPSWVVAQHGAELVQDVLRKLRDRVRAVDPVRPITHANWPVTKGLALDFFDLAAFNLYALWPPEVVARGYGNYVREVLLPLAGERPLLLTEFGANSLEAGLSGQARLARECWTGLRAGGAIGGFVFAFADEWWKNYSNPRVAGSYWDRESDLADHLQHDEDPEEHYGILTADRQPKPAYEEVSRMYAEALGQASAARRRAPLVAAVIALAMLAFLAARRLRRREARLNHQDPQPEGNIDEERNQTLTR